MSKAFAVVLGSLLLFSGQSTETRAEHFCTCRTTAMSNGGTLLICPSGDGPALASIGAQIEIIVLDEVGSPVVGMPAGDFWIQRPTTPNMLCGGPQSSGADGPSDSQGRTAMSGSVAAGGFYDQDAHAVAAGCNIQADPECLSPLPLVLVSPDMNGDLMVNIIDLSMFALAFPPNAFAKQADMNGDGGISLVDVALFAAHWGHSCGS